MCAACVAQGAVYVGGAVGTLRLMAARAAATRARRADDVERVERVGPRSTVAAARTPSTDGAEPLAAWVVSRDE